MSYQLVRSCNVVKIQRKNGQVLQWCDVYIGRSCHRGGWNLSKSKWHNPFVVGKHGDVTEVLFQYENHVRNSYLINDIDELYGKTLGCWCAPNYCHGHILQKLLREKYGY